MYVNCCLKNGTQGSYRNLTVVFRLFYDKITSFSRLSNAFYSSLCETKPLQNWFFNAEISHAMYFSILNTKRDSNV